MRVIGLVGGIGSGKTTAAEMLAELGAEVLYADRIGHEVYRPGGAGFAAVVEAFGPDIVGPDGQIDRKALGAVVFSSADQLERLNAIVHPLLRAEIERRIRAARSEGRAQALVLEAAILLEAGWRDLVDEVWVISAGRDRVTERLAAQRGLSAEQVGARIAHQMSDVERRAAADVVVENDGSPDDLRRRLRARWQDAVRR